MGESAARIEQNAGGGAYLLDQAIGFEPGLPDGRQLLFDEAMLGHGFEKPGQGVSQILVSWAGVSTIFVRRQKCRRIRAGPWQWRQDLAGGYHAASLPGGNTSRYLSSKITLAAFRVVGSGTAEGGLTRDYGSARGFFTFSTSPSRALISRNTPFLSTSHIVGIPVIPN